MAKVESIEGIGNRYSEKLNMVGVVTVESLLELGATQKGRKELASRVKVSEKEVLNWVNRADLCRIKGIGAQYADLLENAGVDSVPELANRNPENLLDRLEQINNERHLVRSMPFLKQVRKWVGRAKDLPRVVSH